MVLHLAERLDVPLRGPQRAAHRGGLVAPSFPARARSTTRSSAAAPQRRSTWILAAHEAYPALALDAHWNLLASNKAVPPLLAGVDPSPL